MRPISDRAWSFAIIIAVSLLVFGVPIRHSWSQPTATVDAEREAEALSIEGLIQQLDSDVTAEANAAEPLLAQTGVAAVPQLTAALTDPYLRYRAARVLGEIGPPAAPAVPALLRSGATARFPFVRDVVVAAIDKIGPIAVPALGEALIREHDYVAREIAAEALAAIGTAAEGALEPLAVVALRDEFGNVSSHASQALARIGAPAVPALIDALADTRFQTRFAAAAALMNIGPPARAAIPALTTALADENRDVADLARRALDRIASAEEVPPVE